MSVETEQLSKSEFIATNIASFKKRMGGELRPCGGCEFFNETTLCDEVRGVQLNQENNPVCPINEKEIKLIILS